VTILKRNAPSVLLIMLVALFVANPIVKAASIPGLAYMVDAIMFVVLIAAVYAEHDRFSWRRPGIWLVVLAVVLRAIVTRLDESTPEASYRYFLVATEVYTAGLIFQICYMLMRQLTRAGRIQTNTVAGVAAVYILLTVAFTSLHIATFAVQGSKAFNGIDHDFALDLASDESSLNKWGPEFMYYSVVTQSTLGYGDITPKSDLARGMAMAQTLVGQLFLAIVLARIVAMELAQRRYDDKEQG